MSTFLLIIPLLSVIGKNSYFNILPTYITTLTYNNSNYYNFNNYFSITKYNNSYELNIKPNRTEYIYGFFRTGKIRWLFQNINYK